MQDLANRLNQAADEMQRAQNAAQNNKEQESLARNIARCSNWKTRSDN